MFDTAGSVNGTSVSEMSPAAKRARLAELLKQKLQPKTGTPAKHAPVSFAQQRLWFLDRLQPGSSFYSMPTAVRLQMPIQVDTLERTLRELVRRHESLRTTFDEAGGQPVQVIAAPLALPLAVVDLRSVAAHLREAEAQRLAVLEARRSFDLARGPLLYATLLQLADADHLLLLTMHHIIGDAWSMEIMLREIAQLYNAFSAGLPSPLPELPLQYADFAASQRARLQGETLERHLNFWRERLRGAPPVLELPLDRPRPASQSFRGAIQPFWVPAGLTRELKALTRREGATFFMTLMTAFLVLLHRYTGLDDLLIGTPIANRNQAEVEGLIGLFLNTLVLRNRIAGNPTFRELLAQVREGALEAYAHQELPFEKLVEELQPERSLSHNPLFQVLFTLQTSANGAAPEVHAVADPVDEPAAPPPVFGVTARFDVSLWMAETAYGLNAGFEYNTDLFESDTIVRMTGHFRTLLRSIVADPEQRIGELPMLTARERAQVLGEWNATAAGEPRRTLHALVEEQAARLPDAPAVEFGGARLSYRELNRRANQLAHHLRARGVGPGALVGICVERSLEMVIAALATFKAGGAYVPLDPHYPAARLSYLLRDARPAVLLTQAALVERLPAHGTAPIRLDADWDAISVEPEHDPAPLAALDDLAYVIYTSGSTGQPKGVMITHRGLANVVQKDRAAWRLTSSDRVLQLASFSFDVAVMDMSMAFGAGATLVLGTREEMQPGEPLTRFIQRERITAACTLPSVLAVLDPAELPQFQTVISASELCPADIPAAWAPGRRFCNGYGPTENTVWSTFTDWTDGTRRPPIGRPTINTRAYVLDRNLQPVPAGVPGELHLAGPQLARGYLNRPGLTAERFVPDPFGPQPGGRMYKTGDLVRCLPDGNIEFLRRIDDQVKVRGYRIELGEIEALLQEHPGVREAAVVTHGSGKDVRLVGYVVEREDGAAAADAVRNYLKERLPEYMVPAQIAYLEALPQMPNGKLDRKALASPEMAALAGNQRAYEAPRTPVETALAEIWKEVLQVGRIGVRDDFFQLGGHSLSATQVISRVRDTFGIEVPLRTVFEAPDLSSFALTIEQQRAGAAPELSLASAGD